MPDLTVHYRDLAARPHLSAASLANVDTDEAASANAVLEEFLAADVLVIGVPMYNFNIPSQLKAWMDRIAVAGKTFRYTAEGPVGLAGVKKMVVAGAYDGFHPTESASNFIEPYLRFMFDFVGINDIEFVTAEGLALSPKQRTTSIQAALARIAATAPKVSAA